MDLPPHFLLVFQREATLGLVLVSLQENHPFKKGLLLTASKNLLPDDQIPSIKDYPVVDSNYQNADNKIFVCKFSKMLSPSYHIEKFSQQARPEY